MTGEEKKLKGRELLLDDYHGPAGLKCSTPAGINSQL